MMNASSWVTAIATIIIAIVALFQEKIRALLQKPRLKVSFTLAPPDCHKIQVYGMQELQSFKADSYYFRFRVRNTGNYKAESVEVFAKELSKMQADGTLKKVDDFPFMNLRWTHSNKLITEIISPKMERICDLGYIIDPALRKEFGETENEPRLEVSANDTVFSFAFQVKKPGINHLISPGKYRVAIIVCAANSKPRQETFELNITGKWSADEKKMLSEGVGIRPLNS